MKTFQDWQAVVDRDLDRAQFVRSIITDHKASGLYKIAKVADDYDRCRNTTTMQYQKMIG